MTKEKPLIVIRRKGVFSVPNLLPDNQCGKTGQTEFNYSVEIAVKSLDKRGFVCDNFDVPKLMDRYKTGYWEGSCEEFAGEGIHMMHGLCQGRAVRIVFEVSPIPEAGVRVEWQKGQSLPDFRVREKPYQEIYVAENSQYAISTDLFKNPIKERKIIDRTGYSKIGYPKIEVHEIIAVPPNKR